MDVLAKCKALEIAWQVRDMDKMLSATIDLQQTVLSRNTKKHKKKNIPRQILDAGSASILAGMLESYWRASDTLCFHILSALSYIIPGASMHKEMVVDSGVLPTIRDIFVESQNMNHVEQAARCLEQFADENSSEDVRARFMSLGIEQSVADNLVRFEWAAPVRYRVGCLARNMCQNTPHELIRPILIAANACIARGKAEDPRVLAASLKAIQNSFGSSFDGIASVFEIVALSDVCNLAVAFPSEEAIFDRVLSIVSNLLSLSQFGASMLLGCNWVEFFSLTISKHAEGQYSYVRACAWMRIMAKGPQREVLAQETDLLSQVVQVFKNNPIESYGEAAYLFEDLVTEAPLDLVESLLKFYPIRQMVFLCYRDAADPRASTVLYYSDGATRARAALSSLLRFPLSSWIKELRDMPVVSMRPILSSVQLATSILRDHHLTWDERYNLVWYLLAAGLPVSQRDEHGVDKGLIVSGAIPESLRRRLRALQSIILIVGFTSASLSGRNRQGPIRAWPSLDVWRLVWQYVFE